MLARLSFSTAEDFLDGIVRSSRDIAAYNQVRRRVYRGHGDTDWHLIPKAFRPNEEFPTTAGWVSVEKQVALFQDAEGDLWLRSPEINRVSLEISTLVMFFDLVDEAGLPLPDDSQVLREQLRQLSPAINLDPGSIPKDWPPLQVRSILALAQHHGLPTRLLDWTWDFRVAAFFAAKDAIKHKTETLAVWGLDAGVLTSLENTLGHLKRIGGFQDERPYRVALVTAPGATNRNLNAQKGVFTLLEPLSASVQAAAALDALADTPGLSQGIGLTKHELPRRCAAGLLKLLEMDGVSAASVFPGFDGVVRRMRDRQLWIERT